MFPFNTQQLSLSLQELHDHLHARCRLKITQKSIDGTAAYGLIKGSPHFCQHTHTANSFFIHSSYPPYRPKAVKWSFVCLFLLTPCSIARFRERFAVLPSVISQPFGRLYIFSNHNTNLTLLPPHKRTASLCSSPGARPGVLGMVL